jgi:hypothetical protein
MPNDKTVAIITDGNNRFEDNTYRVPRDSGLARFVWRRDVTVWDGFRHKGKEQGGRLVAF